MTGGYGFPWVNILSRTVIESKKWIIRLGRAVICLVVYFALSEINLKELNWWMHQLNPWTAACVSELLRDTKSPFFIADSYQGPQTRLIVWSNKNKNKWICMQPNLSMPKSRKAKAKWQRNLKFVISHKRKSRPFQYVDGYRFPNIFVLIDQWCEVTQHQSFLWTLPQFLRKHD